MSNIFGGNSVTIPQLIFTISDPDIANQENESTTHAVNTLCALEHFDDSYNETITAKGILAEGSQKIGRVQTCGVILTFMIAILASAAFIASMLLIFLANVPLTSWLIIGLLTLTAALLVTLAVTIPVVFLLVDNAKYHVMKDALKHISQNIKKNFRAKQDALGAQQPFQCKQTMTAFTAVAQIKDKHDTIVMDECTVTTIPSYTYKVVNSMPPASPNLTKSEYIVRVSLEAADSTGNNENISGQ